MFVIIVVVFAVAATKTVLKTKGFQNNYHQHNYLSMCNSDCVIMYVFMYDRAYGSHEFPNKCGWL